MHELAIHAVKPGDGIKDVSPQVEIISLVYDPLIGANRQFGAAINGSAWKVFEDHLHLPLEEDIVPLSGNGKDIHVQLLTARRQAFTHPLKFDDPLNPLNAVFKHDVIVIIRVNMRPIGLTY